MIVPPIGHLSYEHLMLAKAGEKSMYNLNTGSDLHYYFTEYKINDSDSYASFVFIRPYTYDSKKIETVTVGYSFER